MSVLNFISDLVNKIGLLSSATVYKLKGNFMRILNIMIGCIRIQTYWDRNKMANNLRKILNILNEIYCILIEMSPKFVLYGLGDNKSALVQVMAWAETAYLKLRWSNSMTYTVKPVCNDHLYNKIYFLWFIQQCVSMKTEDTNLLLLTMSAFWSSSRWPLKAEKYPIRWSL